MKLYTWEWTIEQGTVAKNCLYNIGKTSDNAKSLTLKGSFLSLLFQYDRAIFSAVFPSEASKSALDSIQRGLLLGLCILPWALDRYLLWPCTQALYGTVYALAMIIGAPTSFALAILSLIGVPFEWAARKIHDAFRFFWSSPRKETSTETLSSSPNLMESSDGSIKEAALKEMKEARPDLTEEALLSELTLWESSKNTSPVSSSPLYLFLDHTHPCPKTVEWILSLNSDLPEESCNTLSPKTSRSILMEAITHENIPLIKTILKQKVLDYSACDRNGKNAWNYVQKWLQSFQEKGEISEEIGSLMKTIAEKYVDQPRSLEQMELRFHREQSVRSPQQENSDNPYEALFSESPESVKDEATKASPSLSVFQPLEASALVNPPTTCTYFLSHLAQKESTLIALYLEYLQQEKKSLSQNETDTSILEKHYNGGNYLHVACANKDLESIMRLIRFDNSLLNEKNTNGKTPLEVLSENQGAEKMSILSAIDSLQKAQSPSNRTL